MLIRHYGPVVSNQLFSALFFHSQLDAFSAACPSLPAVLFLSPALIPSLPSILHRKQTGTSTNLLHCSCSSVYLAIFRSYTSSHLVSQGTVSSTITSFPSFGDHITMSGLCAVWMMFGKNSYFPRSTFISQQSDSSKIDVIGVFVFLPV